MIQNRTDWLQIKAFDKKVTRKYRPFKEYLVHSLNLMNLGKPVESRLIINSASGDRVPLGL